MFSHLHVHTQYSLLDGACKIGELLDKVKDMGMTSCAITDHGAMYGVVEFYQQARARGIHPVIGCEMYVCENMLEKASAAREYAHLVLLCENQVGYQNLIKLVSEGFTRGFYYKPRVDYALLKEHSEGLIALSACLSGDIPTLLLNGRDDDARNMVRRYQDIFGEGNFFIEIQDHNIEDEKRVLPKLVKLAREMNLPLAATNDCHYLSRDDAEAQDILMCIQTGKVQTDENRMRMRTQELYVKSEDEMRSLFPNLDDAIENTEKIAQRCHVEFDFSARHLPKYPLEPGQDPDALLTGLCEAGLKERYGEDREDARERLAYELNTIRAMGFIDYFLITWDFIKYAKDNGIYVGPGRGSGAGSIVAYCLDITMVDPLKYTLLFERFLNPERISMPDLDIDFDYERRSEVIDYVTKKYGADHVAQIITFGTMAARAVLRDVGRVLGMTYAEVDAVVKMVPFELNMTLQKAIKSSPELRAAYEENESTKKLIDTGMKLEGMPRHASTHAAGVLITSQPVSDYVPLQTNDDVITTQFTMNTLESLGLLKMDFLGLRTLTVIGDSLNMLKASGIEMQPEDIPIDDPRVYEMIASGDTDGVFQLESGGMRQCLMNMKPEHFEDIIAAISLYRPGPMESIPRYIEGKFHPEKVQYLHDKLRPILGVTYGCMVYQEQVMQIVRDLAGYSMGRSDLVRRAMSKKKHDVMAQEEAYFIHGKEENGVIEVPGAVRNGVPEKVAKRLFDEMTAFASYAFNKSHAAAYGVIAVQTAWLKLHYPVEFMAALMNSVMGSADKIAYYIQYLRRHGVKVLPPDVSVSGARFSVEVSQGEKAVRFGLAAVKNVGFGAIEEIANEVKARGPYKDLFDFANRLAGGAVNKKAVESLIRAGAMDNLPGTRFQKEAVFESAIDGATKRRKTNVGGQLSLFEGDDSIVDDLAPPELPALREPTRRQLLAMEKEMTGVYITGHPLDEYTQALSSYQANYKLLSAYAEEPDHGLRHDGESAVMAGIIVEKRTKITRNDSIMAFVQLEDLYGVTEVIVFPRVYETYSQDLEPDALLTLSGRLSVREEETPKLILERVSPLVLQKREALEEMPSELEAECTFAPENQNPECKTLYLKLQEASELEDAALILMPTPGGIPVVFVTGESEKRTAPRNLWVSGAYNEPALKRRFGDQHVVMK